MYILYYIILRRKHLHNIYFFNALLIIYPIFDFQTSIYNYYLKYSYFTNREECSSMTNVKHEIIDTLKQKALRFYKRVMSLLILFICIKLHRIYKMYNWIYTRSFRRHVIIIINTISASRRICCPCTSI